MHFFLEEVNQFCLFFIFGRNLICKVKYQQPIIRKFTVPIKNSIGKKVYETRYLFTYAYVIVIDNRSTGDIIAVIFGTFE